MSKKKNIFISHVSEDDALVQDLKRLLRRNGYEVRDSSIDSTKPNQAKNPDYIKGEILAPRIKWAGTMVVLISHDTNKSQWVEWEIERAVKTGRRLVGVWTQGAQDADAPKGLDIYADAIVGWQAERVMGAILGDINTSCNADGSERPPRDIPRYKCAS